MTYASTKGCQDLNRGSNLSSVFQFSVILYTSYSYSIYDLKWLDSKSQRKKALSSSGIFLFSRQVFQFLFPWGPYSHYYERVYAYTHCIVYRVAWYRQFLSIGIDKATKAHSVLSSHLLPHDTLFHKKTYMCNLSTATAILQRLAMAVVAMLVTAPNFYKYTNYSSRKKYRSNQGSLLNIT